MSRLLDLRPRIDTGSGEELTRSVGQALERNMTMTLARLKYPASAFVAGAACVVALSFAHAQVTPPEASGQSAVKDDAAASAARSSAVPAGQAAPSAAAHISTSRSAAMQAGQATPANAAKLGTSRSAALPAQQAAPANAAQVSRARTASLQSAQVNADEQVASRSRSASKPAAQIAKGRKNKKLVSASRAKSRAARLAVAQLPTAKTQTPYRLKATKSE